VTGERRRRRSGGERRSQILSTGQLKKVINKHGINSPITAAGGRYMVSPLGVAAVSSCRSRTTNKMCRLSMEKKNELCVCVEQSRKEKIFDTPSSY
jgi:hypothetical protein